MQKMFSKTYLEHQEAQRHQQLLLRVDSERLHLEHQLKTI